MKWNARPRAAARPRMVVMVWSIGMNMARLLRAGHIFVSSRSGSIALRLGPGHRELVTAPHIPVAVEVEPDRHDDIEDHHRDQLRAIAQEDREEGDGAEKEKTDCRDRVERMGVSAPDRAQRPFLAEHHDIDAHEG